MTFIIILRCYLPYILCWYLYWWCKRCNKTADTLALIKAVASNYILYHYACTLKGKETVLNEAVKRYKVLIPEYIFLIFSVKNGNVHVSTCYTLKYENCISA